MALMPAVMMVILISQFCWAQEKLKFADSSRGSMGQALPIATALDKGFWWKQGLEVEHVSFRSGSQMGQAMAGGHIKIATGTSLTTIQQIARGLQVLMVASVRAGSDWGIWVSPNGPLKKPADLKGKKMGISRLGGTSHAIVKMLAKSLGIEKDLDIVAVGGFRARVAGLKTGAIDAFPQAMSSAAPLVVKGGLRRLIDIGNMLPQPWIYGVTLATKDFLRTKPETARKSVRGMV
ncbi:MAG: ABC transporter substrate-binding protein [Thermodesulfobacteriota bacterium]